jgi:hypothetical protein
VDYSLLIMTGMLKTLERLEVQLGMTPTTFPPQIFDGGGFSVCCFGVSIVALPSLWIAKRGIYIVSFRSRRSPR